MADKLTNISDISDVFTATSSTIANDLNIADLTTIASANALDTSTDFTQSEEFLFGNDIPIINHRDKESTHKSEREENNNETAENTDLDESLDLNELDRRAGEKTICTNESSIKRTNDENDEMNRDEKSLDKAKTENETENEKEKNDDENEDDEDDEDNNDTVSKKKRKLLDEEGGEEKSEEDAYDDNDFEISDDEDEEEEEEEDEEEKIVKESENEKQTSQLNIESLSKLESVKTSQERTADELRKMNASNEPFKLSLSQVGEPSTSQHDEAKNRANEEANAKELLRKRKLEQLEEENKKMQVLMANFSEEQLNRYEVFRRSAFPKSSIKKIIQTVCGKTISPSVVIAMSGIAKVFVGEIVEKALDIREKWNDSGPIQPKHLREAYRLFKNSNRLSTSAKSKRPQLF